MRPARNNGRNDSGNSREEANLETNQSEAPVVCGLGNGKWGKKVNKLELGEDSLRALFPPSFRPEGED